MAIWGLLNHFLHPTHCYALCTVARSGAHLLTAGLRSTHLAGRPLQYFHEHLALKYAARHGLDAVHRFPEYVRGIVPATASANGVFGFRQESWDLPRLIDRLRASEAFGPATASEKELLDTAFPRLRYVHLTRDDKLRQAISKARAMQTDRWVGGKSDEPPPAARFDPELIAHCLLSARHAEESWQDLFRRNSIDPLLITYEQLCADYSGTVGRVLEFLDLKLPPQFSLGSPQTVRQADATTEEWLERYRALSPPFDYG